MLATTKASGAGKWAAQKPCFSKPSKSLILRPEVGGDNAARKHQLLVAIKTIRSVHLPNFPAARPCSSAQDRRRRYRAVSPMRLPSLLRGRQYPHMAGPDDYLRETKLADHPPSATFYDPDHVENVTRNFGFLKSASQSVGSLKQSVESSLCGPLGNPCLSVDRTPGVPLGS